ncbi:MAG: DNA polymerase III subunit delta, partial [Alistipes sp.]|nr:DNA polymerase III subunit delta [Alistipes sp.]
LLQTILSRTQEVAVPRISTEVLEAVAARHGQSDPARLHNLARLAGGDYLTLQRLLAGEDDELTRDCFGLFCSLMRLSYNDKHLELVSWAEEVAHLSREQQRVFLRHAARLLRESYMLHAGLADISYLWGAEADFCGKFAPFIGNENVEFLLDEIERAMRQITQNGNPTIVFTHFALSVSKQIRRK